LHSAQHKQAFRQCWFFDFLSFLCLPTWTAQQQQQQRQRALSSINIQEIPFQTAQGERPFDKWAEGETKKGLRRSVRAFKTSTREVKNFFHKGILVLFMFFNCSATDKDASALIVKL